MVCNTGMEEAAVLTTAAQNGDDRDCSVYLSIVTSEELLTVQAHDLNPYVTLTVSEHRVT
jgi:hypothetical protein